MLTVSGSPEAIATGIVLLLSIFVLGVAVGRNIFPNRD